MIFIRIRENQLIRINVLNFDISNFHTQVKLTIMTIDFVIVLLSSSPFVPETRCISISDTICEI